VIGIVDAYDAPNIESDLGVFNRQFDLPICSSSNGCFRKTYANGHKPATNANWGIEIARDVGGRMRLPRKPKSFLWNRQPIASLTCSRPWMLRCATALRLSP
jgi:hypothetical protein